MRIVMSADFEGASGIVCSRETGYPSQPVGDPEATPDYLTGRRWLTADVNAAAEGALDAGATSIVVHDSHGYGYRNIDLDELHPSVEVVRGLPIFFYQHEDLETGYDAAFLIAMHARGGEPGVISHVLDWPNIQHVRLNGELVGESQISVALASHYGIPTILVTGDDVICNEMSEWSGGDIETAVVKTSISRYAARCLPLDEARQRIREAAFRAVSKVRDVQAKSYDNPVTLEVEFNDRLNAWYASLMPTVSYDGNCTVSFTSDDFLSVYKVMVAMYRVARG